MQSAILVDMRKQVIQVEVSEGDDGYFIAECAGLSFVTQGKTLDELAYNIREATELAIEDEDMSELGYVDNPSILVNFELGLAHA